MNETEVNMATQAQKRQEVAKKIRDLLVLRGIEDKKTVFTPIDVYEILVKYGVDITF